MSTGFEALIFNQILGPIFGGDGLLLFIVLLLGFAILFFLNRINFATGSLFAIILLTGLVCDGQKFICEGQVGYFANSTYSTPLLGLIVAGVALVAGYTFLKRLNIFSGF